MINVCLLVYGMKIFGLVLILTLLVACNQGTPRFWNAPAHRVSVDGIEFEVRRVGDLVQAERLTWMLFPKRSAVLGPARQAVWQVTGCHVVGLDPAYDPSVLTMRVRC